MTDEAVQPEADETPETATTETPETEPPAGETAPSDEQSQSEDDMPEWGRKELEKVRNEAAKYRTRAKEAAEAARQEVESEFTDRVATLESERDVLKNDLDNTRLELTKVRVALASNVSGEDALEFARLLQGETEEELTEHAEKVKKLMNSAGNVGAYDRYQGYGKSKSADPQSDFGAFIFNQLKR